MKSTAPRQAKTLLTLLPPSLPPLHPKTLEASLDEYFHEPIEDVIGNNVRWISITGLEPSVVVRLANR